MHLTIDSFKHVIKSTPLISIDLIVENENGEILLGYRKNRPAKNHWFVPGGRILKDETMTNAFRRLTLNELGLTLELSDAELIGPFEHFYHDNVTDDEFSTHYIALGYKVVVNTLSLILPIEQHSKYKWLDINSLLAHDSVHQHSKWYFKK